MFQAIFFIPAGDNRKLERSVCEFILCLGWEGRRKTGQHWEVVGSNPEKLQKSWY